MRIGRLGRDCRAAASAEFAMILPGIAFVLLNVVDLSIYIWSKMQVDLAAHEAVGYARAKCDSDAKLPALDNSGTKCAATLLADMQSAAQTTSLGSGVTIASTAEDFYCASASGDLGSPVSRTAADCSGTVAGSTSAPGVYIRTTASYAFSPVFPGASVASLLTTPITRTAWLRLK